MLFTFINIIVFGPFVVAVVLSILEKYKKIKAAKEIFDNRKKIAQKAKSTIENRKEITENIKEEITATIQSVKNSPYTIHNRAIGYGIVAELVAGLLLITFGVKKEALDYIFMGISVMFLSVAVPQWLLRPYKSEKSQLVVMLYAFLFGLISVLIHFLKDKESVVILYFIMYITGIVAVITYGYFLKKEDKEQADDIGMDEDTGNNEQKRNQL